MDGRNLLFAASRVAILRIVAAEDCNFELSAAGLMLVLAMAIGPQLVGHTAINYAARHLRSTLVSVAILGEPVLSAALAWALLGEAIAPLQLLGFAITLCGILCCALDERAR